VLLGQRVSVLNNSLYVRSIEEDGTEDDSIASEIVALSSGMGEQLWLTALVMVMSDASNHHSDIDLGVFHGALQTLCGLGDASCGNGGADVDDLEEGATGGADCDSLRDGQRGACARALLGGYEQAGWGGQGGGCA